MECQGHAAITAECLAFSTAALKTMTSEIAIQPVPAVVDTPDGPVTQTSVESLELLVRNNQAAGQALAHQIAQTETQVQAMQAQAGSLLTQRQKEWASADRGPRIDVARGLEELIASLESQIAQLQAQTRQGLTGIIRGLKDQHDIGSLQAKLQSARVELTARYRAVAEQLDPPTGIVEADQLLSQIKSDLAQSAQLEAEQKDLVDRTTRINDEIARRKSAVADLGFDAPAVEADLIANGLRAVPANLVLKRNEIPVVSVVATLCRYRTRTQYVGSSQGFSIPLGHGLRYRVSSYRGHPIQVESLTTVDEGSLVVTNQRLVFLGKKRDVSSAIAKLLQIEAFSNGLAIGREGKETRDIFLVPHPAYVVLFLQWIVSHQG